MGPPLRYLSDNPCDTRATAEGRDDAGERFWDLDAIASRPQLREVVDSLVTPRQLGSSLGGAPALGRRTVRRLALALWSSWLERRLGPSRLAGRLVKRAHLVSKTVTHHRVQAGQAT